MAYQIGEMPLNRFRQTFAHRHVVLPVIHVVTEEQTVRNAQVARDAGADGVFLIGHGVSQDRVLVVCDTVLDAMPDWWIGLNCLGLSADRVFQSIAPRVAGVWVDDAGIDEGQWDQPYADHVGIMRRRHAPASLYFGGVAFKYQRPVHDLEGVCDAARRHMDVVTTSGPGTGRAAEVTKIQRMREALGDAPLAIASGITPENVDQYLPYADCFLVATGISRSDGEFDSRRVLALVERVKSFGA